MHLRVYNIILNYLHAISTRSDNILLVDFGHGGQPTAHEIL